MMALINGILMIAHVMCHVMSTSSVTVFSADGGYVTESFHKGDNGSEALHEDFVTEHSDTEHNGRYVTESFHKGDNGSEGFNEEDVTGAFGGGVHITEPVVDGVVDLINADDFAIMFCGHNNASCRQDFSELASKINAKTTEALIEEFAQLCHYIEISLERCIHLSVSVFDSNENSIECTVDILRSISIMVKNKYYDKNTILGDLNRVETFISCELWYAFKKAFNHEVAILLLHASAKDGDLLKLAIEKWHDNTVSNDICSYIEYITFFFPFSKVSVDYERISNSICTNNKKKGHHLPVSHLLHLIDINFISYKINFVTDFVIKVSNVYNWEEWYANPKPWHMKSLFEIAHEFEELDYSYSPLVQTIMEYGINEEEGITFLKSVPVKFLKSRKCVELLRKEVDYAELYAGFITSIFESTLQFVQIIIEVAERNVLRSCDNLVIVINEMRKFYKYRSSALVFATKVVYTDFKDMDLFSMTMMLNPIKNQNGIKSVDIDEVLNSITDDINNWQIENPELKDPNRLYKVFDEDLTEMVFSFIDNKLSVDKNPEEQEKQVVGNNLENYFTELNKWYNKVNNEDNDIKTNEIASSVRSPDELSYVYDLAVDEP